MGICRYSGHLISPSLAGVLLTRSLTWNLHNHSKLNVSAGWPLIIYRYAIHVEINSLGLAMARLTLDAEALLFPSRPMTGMATQESAGKTSQWWVH
jgi:hypothetical protein